MDKKENTRVIQLIDISMVSLDDNHHAVKFEQFIRVFEPL